MLKYEGFVKKILIGPLWGGVRIIPRSLKTTGNKNCFQPGAKKFLKSYMSPLYLLIIGFPKFDPLTVTGMALCVDFGPKCHNLFCWTGTT
jgi:hypothetical protein